MLNITSPDFTIVGQPDGLSELRHRIYYSNELSGYLEEFAGQLTFYGDEYTYLRRRFFADGCAVIPIVLTDGVGLQLTANLFLNDATWQIDRQAVTCEVVDDSYLSLIDNNKGIKAFVNVPRSKNDLPITAVEQTDLLFKAYDVVNNLDTPADRYGVRVYDALRTLVEFMSDGLIGFESDFFNTDDDPAVNRPRIPTLLTGRAIRTGADDSFVFISFEELFIDLNKLYNLAFAVERTTSGPVLRIEPKSYFREVSTSLALPNVYSIQQTSDQSSFYSKVSYGSAKVDEYIFYPGGALPPSLPFVQWSQEEYHLGGQCNKDVFLDLELKTLITDTNVIMRCLPYGASNPQSLVTPPDSSYDDDIFLVLFDANNETITSESALSADLRIYNGRLINSEVAQRWGDGIPYPIYLFLDGVTNNDAKGGLTANVTLDFSIAPPIWIAQWANDNIPFTVYYLMMQFPVRTPPTGYDSNTNMADGVISTMQATWYEAPNTAIYTINTELYYDGDMRGFVIVQLRGGSFVQASEPFYNDPDNIPFVNRSARGTFTVAAAAGDRFYVVCVLAGQAAYPPPAPVFPPILKPDSFMEVFASGNQITQTYDPQSNYLVNSSFNYPVPSTDWQFFNSNRFGTINVTHGFGVVTGFLKEASRNLYNGSTDFVLRSRFAES